MIVLTNLCIQLIPFFVSFFPTSFEPPYTTTTSCCGRCRISLFAEVVIVLTPVPGFTNQTSKLSSRFNCISAAHPHAWLSPITIILCFFSTCLFFALCTMSLLSFFTFGSCVLIGSRAISS